MTERDWEIYRLNVVESMPDSLFKIAVIEGIRQKLELLEQAEIGQGSRSGLNSSYKH
jgi:hypothetical protein